LKDFDNRGNRASSRIDPAGLLEPERWPTPTGMAASSEIAGPVLKIVGKQTLSGHVPIGGSKNSALALMAGSLLAPAACRIHNVPRLLDIERMGQILATLGVKVSHVGNTLDLDASSLRTCQAPYELVSQLRASFLIIGPLVARLGVARVPLPGGLRHWFASRGSACAGFAGVGGNGSD
jgi:UDP-N-acetylglucosamine 1-carboxyvinyltransferase